MDNRRDFYRLQLWGLVDVKITAVDFVTEGKINNISAKGISLKVPRALNLEGILDLEFELDGKTFIRKGLVVRCRICEDSFEYEAGVEFIQPNNEQVEMFRTLFSVAAKTTNIK